MFSYQMKLHNQWLDELRVFYRWPWQLLLRHLELWRGSAMTRCVPMIGLVLGDGRGLVTALQNSNSTKFLKCRWKFFCSSSHDPMKIDRVLGNVNLNQKYKNSYSIFWITKKNSFSCIVLNYILSGITMQQEIELEKLKVKKVRPVGVS